MPAFASLVMMIDVPFAFSLLIALDAAKWKQMKKGPTTPSTNKMPDGPRSGLTEEGSKVKGQSSLILVRTKLGSIHLLKDTHDIRPTPK
jgi:hypothetical protein